MAAVVVALVVGSGVLAVPGAGAAPVGAAPSVTDVAVSSAPAAGDTYLLGETVRVRVDFSEPVAVNTADGTPRLAIDMDPAEWGQKWAAYESGSGTASLTFSHAVVEPNFSSQGVAVLADSLETDGGSITSVASGTAAVLAHSGLGHDPAHKVDWQRSASAPSVTAVAIGSEPAGGDTYVLGETVRVTVSFSAAVEVDTAGGAPRLAIDMDPAEWGQKWASYESGSGTASLTFAHAVVEPNFSSQGVAVLADSLEPNGGTITSAASGNSAVLAHTGLGHDPSHKVDWQQAPAGGQQDTNRAPVVDAGAAAYAQLTGVNNAPRGVLVSKPFHEVFSDPDGDELSYTVEITDGDAVLVDELEVTLDAAVRRPGQKWPPVGAYDRVWFKAEADSEWKAKSPVPADRPLVTVTLTATDPDGLSASVSGVFKIHWDSYPEVVEAGASPQAITLTYDIAVLDDPAPAAGQFTVHVRDADGTTSTVEVTSVSVSDSVVTLALASELTAGQTVTLDYTYDYPVDIPLLRADGAEHGAPSFTGQTVDMSAIELSGPVQNLTVTAEPGQPWMLVTWDPMASATSYKLRWRLAGTEFEADNATSVTAAHQFIDVPKPGRWEVRVQACNDTRCGPEATVSADVVRAAKLSLKRAADTEGRARTLGASWDTVDDAASYQLIWRRLGAASSTTTPDTDAAAAAQTRTRRGTSADNAPDAGTDAMQTRGEMTLPAARASADIGVPDAGSYEVELRAVDDDDELIAVAKHNINQAPGQPDTTAPRLIGGQMDGHRARLFFSEPLDESTVGGRWHPYVQYADCWCSAGGITQVPMEVSGNTVTVNHFSTRAVEGLRASIAYWLKPGDTSLRDLAGNKVSTPNVGYDGSRSSRKVGLHNVTGRPKILPIKAASWGPPSGIAISSDAGDDRFYVLGDQIKVAVSFSEAVTVDTTSGTPTLRIDLDPAAGGEKWATYAGGSGSQRLEFVYTVADDDFTLAGVAVLADTLQLNGGTIRAAWAVGDEHARLGHGGLGHDQRHRVVTPAGDAPILSKASVNGTTLTLTFSEPLGAAASLANSAFTVKKTPQGGSEQTVTLSGSPSISAAAVTLTLAAAVGAGDTGVKVSYAKPSSGTANKLVDTDGAEAADFTDEWVINELDTTAPTLDRGEIKSVGSGMVDLTLYFSEPLDEHSAGAADYYRVHLQSRPVGVGNSFTAEPMQVTVTGNKVVVRYWARSVYYQPIARQRVAMIYVTDRDSQASRLQDLAGNPVHTPRHRGGSYWEIRAISLTNLTQ